MRINGSFVFRIRGMVAILIPVGALLLPPASLAFGQEGAANPAQEPEKFTQAQLDELVGPIALYPDVLIAQILPASTYPMEIVQAARFLEDQKGKVDEKTIKALSWDPSVLALMHYPEVIQLLNEDLDWTQTLGDAVSIQQENVMAAIQRFRQKALVAGNLTTSEQMIVVREQQTIVITSASPTVVYVPVYNPQVVVVRKESSASVIAFGTGVAVGAWLGYACNWGSSSITVKHRSYWGVVRPGWGRVGVWRPRSVGGVARRAGRGAGRRAARRTTRRRTGLRPVARPVARPGARAGARTGARTGARAGARAGARTGVRTGARPGARTGARRTTARRGASPAARRNTGRAYGGYKSGNRARRNSSRGSRSRSGGAGRSRGGRRGGGRRR